MENLWVSGWEPPAAFRAMYSYLFRLQTLPLPLLTASLSKEMG